MNRSAYLVLALWLIVPVAGWARTAPPLAIEVGADLTLPLGQSGSIYTPGAGGGLGGVYTLPGLPVLALRAGLDLAALPTLAGSVLVLVTALAGAGLSVDLLPWLGLEAYALAGWGQGFYEGQSGGSAVISALARVRVILVPSFALALGVSYRHYFSQPEPFYQALGLGLAAVVRVGRR